MRPVKFVEKLAARNALDLVVEYRDVRGLLHGTIVQVHQVLHLPDVELFAFKPGRAVLDRQVHAVCVGGVASALIKTALKGCLGPICQVRGASWGVSLLATNHRLGARLKLDRILTALQGFWQTTSI